MSVQVKVGQIWEHRRAGEPHRRIRISATATPCGVPYAYAENPETGRKSVVRIDRLSPRSGWHQIPSESEKP